MKETKFKKENKGITLIALIVTIIVILLLAGVTVMTLAEENGVINKAVRAKQKSEDARVVEEIRLAVLAAMTNEQYTVDEYILEESLTSAFGEKGTDYKLEGDSSTGWTIEVKDLKYKVTANGIVEEVEPPVEISTLINNADKTNNPYADKTKAVKDKSDTAQTFYIPKDFKLASDSADKVDDGIVVEDENGNQFVWVPVPVAVWDATKYDENQIGTEINGEKYTPMATTYKYPNDETGKTYYRGMLYGFNGTTAIYESNYNVGTTSFREPSLLTGNSDDIYAPMSSVTGSSYDNNSTYVKNILGYDDATKFGEQMQKDYDDMVKSVQSYGGFYVGRYETGIEGSNVVSKNARTNSSVTTADASQNATKYWYGLYKTQKNFAISGSVRSSMIWGSQYDAMMNWMAKNGKTLGTPASSGNYNSTTTTGYNGNDVLIKVYDLYGCHCEWTLEAGSTFRRTMRGGYAIVGNSPNIRHYSGETTNVEGKLRL